MSQQETRLINNIKKSKLSIYDKIAIENKELWIPAISLQKILKKGLCGHSLKDLPLRTRSKEVKKLICKSLGYPAPDSFKKVKPRFYGQNFDIYIQKSKNLQIWNEDISIDRRYIIIIVNKSDIISRIKLIQGKKLQELDITGTLTQKFQAQIIPNQNELEVIGRDTKNLKKIVKDKVINISSHTPVDRPDKETLLSIKCLGNLMKKLIGQEINYVGADQERNRGAEIHKLVCKKIGYGTYQDFGTFPDIPHQLLEIKLQSSPTIDLGLVLPNSVEILNGVNIDNIQARHCDVRYLIFYSERLKNKVKIKNIIIVTGEKFFTRFRQFGGKKLNKKLQIKLPVEFFD